MNKGFYIIIKSLLKQKIMKEMELLKTELALINDNIVRLEKYIETEKQSKWTPCNSHIFGELKHRLISAKQRFTIVCNVPTSQLFR